MCQDSRDMKIEILGKIAQAGFYIKAYLYHDELKSIASALMLKYTCLNEPGKGRGYEGWLVSIRKRLITEQSCEKLVAVKYLLRRNEKQMRMPLNTP